MEGRNNFEAEWQSWECCPTLYEGTGKKSTERAIAIFILYYFSLHLMQCFYYDCLEEKWTFSLRFPKNQWTRAKLFFSGANGCKAWMRISNTVRVTMTKWAATTLTHHVSCKKHISPSGQITPRLFRSLRSHSNHRVPLTLHALQVNWKVEPEITITLVVSIG